MAQTYCDYDDIVSIIGAAAVLACIDDDSDGNESTVESTQVTQSIERAAVEMNSALGCQYVLSELASNDWCKWCNAYLACYYLMKRRANPLPTSIGEDISFYRQQLEEARWGRFQVPEQASSFDHTAAVSNFRPEIYKNRNPIRVVTEESTREAPEDGVKREQANVPGWL